MMRRCLPVVLAALAVASLVLPSKPAWAADPPAVEPSRLTPPRQPVWTGPPPETVSAATAMLHDACAGWPKHVPSGSEVDTHDLDLTGARVARACDFALDPEDYTDRAMLNGGVLGAIAAGLAVVAFQLAKLLLFVLGRVMRRGLDALRRGVEALWDRRPPRFGGWSR